jgi:Phage integrase, N-terminal SAM-like domain
MGGDQEEEGRGRVLTQAAPVVYVPPSFDLLGAPGIVTRSGVAMVATPSLKECVMTPLRQRMIEDMRIRNFTEQTQTSYCQYVSQFARHFRRSPEHLGPEEIRTYQHYLVHEKKLSASSLFVAVGALRFLYKVTLKKGWPIATPTRRIVTKNMATPVSALGCVDRPSPDGIAADGCGDC